MFFINLSREKALCYKNNVKCQSSNSNRETIEPELDQNLSEVSGEKLLDLSQPKRSLQIELKLGPKFRFRNCHCEGTEAIPPFSMRLPRLRAETPALLRRRIALRRAGTHLVPLLAGLAMTGWEKGFGF